MSRKRENDRRRGEGGGVVRSQVLNVPKHQSFLLITAFYNCVKTVG